MAKTVVGLEVKVNSGQAEGSVKSLKQQLREAQADVATLSEKFGATSQAAINAAKKAAELKDAIGDAKALTDAFNPDRKFQAFSSAIQGVVGGFSALQGAQALFGAESEDLQKVLVKVQAAMALSQGINSIMEAKDAFKILGTVIKTNVVGAFSSLRAAIISTGIGALIVAVGILINQISEYAASAEDAAEAQKKLNEETKKFADIGLKGEQDFLSRQEKVDIARAKLAGKSEKEIFEIQQQYRADRIKSLQRYHDEVKNADASAGIDAINQIKNINAEGQAARAEFELKQKEERKKANEEYKKSQEERLSIQKKYNEDALKLQDELTIKLQDLNQSAEQVEINELTRKYNEQLNVLKLGHQSTIAAEYLYQEELRKIKEKYAPEVKEDFNPEDLPEVKADAQKTLVLVNNSKERMKWTQLEYEQKVQVTKDIGNALGALSDLVGQQTAAGKALAVAQSLINTYTGATEVLRAKSVLPEPFGTISKVANVAAIVATGLKAVKQIVATKVPGSSSSMGSISAPIATQIGGTQLNQAQVNQLSSATARAFVLESDVSGNQERIRRLNRAARIN